jgi:pyridoxal phosphate enzyme (YggS family)
MEDRTFDRGLIRRRLESVLATIEDALRRANRSPHEVSLIVVTKRFPLEVIATLVELGVRHLGENYTSELAKKWRHFPDRFWHLIGPPQRRHLKELRDLLSHKESSSSFSPLTIHTVDSVETLKKIEGALGRIVPFFIEVNIGREPQKAGVLEEDLFPLIEAILTRYPDPPLLGLMAIPPYHPDPEGVRPYFRRMRELRDELAQRFHRSDLGLSMGMSHDYPVAISEGATWVRIGQAILGPRG